MKKNRNPWKNKKNEGGQSWKYEKNEKWKKLWKMWKYSGNVHSGKHIRGYDCKPFCSIPSIFIWNTVLRIFKFCQLNLLNIFSKIYTFFCKIFANCFLIYTKSSTIFFTENSIFSQHVLNIYSKHCPQIFLSILQ